MKDRNYADLKNLATQLGADLFGVAERIRLDKYIADEIKTETAKLPFVISIGVRLQTAALDTLVDRPNHIYKTHYRQANSLLDLISFRLSKHMQNCGHRAIPIAASYILDWQKQNSHVSHRHAALEAGLGFWGRNNLLVHPQYGAAVRLTSIFTNMPLAVDQPIPNDCRDCVACMEACPADAIDGDKFDFERCYSQVREFAKQNNYNLYLCGLCVKACANARKQT
jgi:epoxyqueuosine reductase QueG